MTIQLEAMCLALSEKERERESKSEMKGGRIRKGKRVRDTFISLLTKKS